MRNRFVVRLPRPTRHATAILGVILVLAGCGGRHTTHPTNTASRPVAKQAGRVIDLAFAGGTATLRPLGDTSTAVSLHLKKAAARGTTAELDKGSCGARNGLQSVKPLGRVSGTTGSWSVTASLAKLTASPLAFVLRKGGRVVVCGNVRSG